MPQTSVDEIHEIILCLRGQNGLKDGDYRATHLATILEYLQRTKSENKMLTLQKLALVIGMSQRQVRENYMDGLIAFGVINLDTTCNGWYWVGVKAITTKFGELPKKQENDDSLQEYARQHPKNNGEKT